MLKWSYTLNSCPMVEIYTILFLSSPNKVIVKKFDRSNIETFIITIVKITIRIKLWDAFCWTNLIRTLSGAGPSAYYDFCLDEISVLWMSQQGEVGLCYDKKYAAQTLRRQLAIKCFSSSVCRKTRNLVLQNKRIRRRCRYPPQKGRRTVILLSAQW